MYQTNECLFVKYLTINQYHNGVIKTNLIDEIGKSIESDALFPKYVDPISEIVL